MPKGCLVIAFRSQQEAPKIVGSLYQKAVWLLQLDLERKLRALLTKEKDKAEEQAALSMGLCTGAFTLP